MQRHIHMHKNLHSAMLAVWRKKNPPQESGAEANADGRMQRSSNAILWQLRILHIPQRKNVLVPLEQQSPNINPKNTSTHQNDLTNLVFMGTYALCSFAVVLLMA
jgi:hypothetical protein